MQKNVLRLAILLTTVFIVLLPVGSVYAPPVITQLTTNTADDQYPSISSDGSKIAFQSEVDGDAEIFVINSDGTGLTQLTTNTADDMAPSTSSDGSRIAFQSEVDGYWEIFLWEADSDNDGLTDWDEVNVYGTDPLDPDSDDDGLTNGDEVNIYGTDPLDPDTDDDGLNDGLEVEHGTDPLDPDADDDGIPDGEDVEWLQNALDALPNSAFKDGDRDRGLRNAMINILNDVELAVASGDIDEAMELLTNLRRHVDGCGLAPDPNDWIVDCAAQIAIRELIDIYIANLS